MRVYSRASNYLNSVHCSVLWMLCDRTRIPPWRIQPTIRLIIQAPWARYRASTDLNMISFDREFPRLSWCGKTWSARLWGQYFPHWPKLLTVDDLRRSTLDDTWHLWHVTPVIRDTCDMWHLWYVTPATHVTPVTLQTSQPVSRAGTAVSSGARAVVIGEIETARSPVALWRTHLRSRLRDYILSWFRRYPAAEARPPCPRSGRW